MNDAPLDGLDWEDEVWTEADVLELDNLIIGRGRERWTTMALGPNDERLRRDAPYVEAIDTDNAASNDAMLAINVAMGFAPLIDWSFWQADTATLRAHAQ